MTLHPMETPHKLPTVIDLFCGAGGLAFGFRKAGFPVGLSVDHNAAAVATARAYLQ